MKLNKSKTLYLAEINVPYHHVMNQIYEGLSFNGIVASYEKSLTKDMDSSLNEQVRLFKEHLHGLFNFLRREAPSIELS